MELSERKWYEVFRDGVSLGCTLAFNEDGAIEEIKKRHPKAGVFTAKLVDGPKVKVKRSPVEQLLF